MANIESTKVLSAVLSAHGIVDPCAEGIIYACVGCGSVGGINPEDGEAARVATRDHYDFTCCSEAETHIF